MQAVILCGGLGTRLGTLTHDRPKYLVPILGRPFCDWQLELLATQGFDEFVFCIGHHGDQIRAHLGDQLYSDEGTRQRGPWAAYRKARHLLDDRHAIIYGDAYLPLTTEFINDCWASPDRIYLRWDGEDYGMRFMDGDLLRMVQAPQRWYEVGSYEGIAELEAYLRAAA